MQVILYHPGVPEDNGNVRRVKNMKNYTFLMVARYDGSLVG